MAKTGHKIFLILLAVTVVAVFILLLNRGYSYYSTSIADRFYHPDDNALKPSGLYGHGFGIIGALFILTGVGSYMARKRYRSLSRIGTLKGWLEIHIFLCTLGPVLILYHTSFKFGGIVAISFWSMVMVVVSGIIGRFIYIQIPRTIEGRELSLNEIRGMKSDLAGTIRNVYLIDDESFNNLTTTISLKKETFEQGVFLSRFIKRYMADRETISEVKQNLKKNNLSRTQYKTILSLVRGEITLNRKIEQLDRMQKLFENWHVAHLPFALVMLVIITIHVIVTVVLGYRWIL
jgi:hypothetical protein